MIKWLKNLFKKKNESSVITLTIPKNMATLSIKFEGGGGGSGGSCTKEINDKMKFECDAGSSSGASHLDLVGGAGTSRYIDIKPYKDK